MRWLSAAAAAVTQSPYTYHKKGPKCRGKLHNVFDRYCTKTTKSLPSRPITTSHRFTHNDAPFRTHHPIHPSRSSRNQKAKREPLPLHPLTALPILNHPSIMNLARKKEQVWQG